jgi:hypothetical protein
MGKECGQCGQKAVAKVKMETGEIVLMCRECVDAAKLKRPPQKAPSSAAPSTPPLKSAGSARKEPAAVGVATATASANTASHRQTSGAELFGSGAAGTNAKVLTSPSSTDSISRTTQKNNSAAPTASPTTQATSGNVDEMRKLLTYNQSEMRKLTRERDDAVRKLDNALELMQAEERKFKAETQTSTGTVRRAAQRAVVAEEQVATLQHELHAAVDKNAALTKQLSATCDRLADVEHQLAQSTAGSRVASAGDAALQMHLAEARAARQEAEAERDTIHAEYDKATETARKRLEYAAQLIVELETKVEDLTTDLADKETQVSILKDQLDQAQLDGIKQLSVRRRKEKSLRTRIKKLEAGAPSAATSTPTAKRDQGAGSGDEAGGDDADPAMGSDSDDGINLSAIPVLFGPGAAKQGKDDASESESTSAPSNVATPSSAGGAAGSDENAAMWRIRAERAEAECVELRARLSKTEERLDAVQDRLVAIMTEKSDAVSEPTAAAAVGAAEAAVAGDAPVVAPKGGPPPAPPPMPLAPMKGNTPLKIGPKSDTSRTALARANNAGMDSIFEKIKSGGVNLRKVTSTDKRRAPIGTAFDQMVQQIKSKNYKINKSIQQEGGRLRFREAPNSVRPADLNEKRVLLDPRTGKPLGEDIEVGGGGGDADDDDDDSVGAKVVQKVAPAAASPKPGAAARSLSTNSITVVEIEDDDEEGDAVTFEAGAVIADLSESEDDDDEPPAPPADLDELNGEDLLD